MTTNTAETGFFENIIEQIKTRYSSEEGEIQRVKAERDEYFLQVSRLRERITQLESQITDSKLLVEQHEETIQDQNEMLARVEKDYSQTLSDYVDMKNENEILKRKLEKQEKSPGVEAENMAVAVNTAISIATGKYGKIYNSLNALFESMSEVEEKAAFVGEKRRNMSKKRRTKLQTTFERVKRVSSREVDTIDLTLDEEKVDSLVEPTPTTKSGFAPAIVTTSMGKRFQCNFMQIPVSTTTTPK